MTDTIAIIDYGSGNLRSAAKAFERVIHDENLKFKVVVTSRPDEIAAAKKIVLPGQGAFGDCMNGLKSRKGLYEIITKQVEDGGVPFLGICVGMQLLAEKGFEHGVHPGFGWIPGNVRKMELADETLKIPHMGWNTLQLLQSHPALRHIRGDDHFYFVHSFVFESKDINDIAATCDYGGNFTAIVARENVIGTQFHTEKSSDAGLRLIKGFLEWKI